MLKETQVRRLIDMKTFHCSIILKYTSYIHKHRIIIVYIVIHICVEE